MEIVKKHLTNGQYLTHEYEKKSIFLHHTEGTNAMSAWRWWNSTPDRVGTAYIIDRDGTIVECFDPKYWAFHLGIHNDDNWHEKHSINIELVSAGKLYQEGKHFRFYPLYPNKLRYTTIPKSEVEELRRDWRGYKYYHKYTEAQMDSVKWLMKEIVVKFPTIKANTDLKSFQEYNSDVIKDHLPGIWSHSTVRRDKTDIYPGPDVLKSLEEVNKEIYDMQNATQIPEVTIKAKSTRVKKGTKSSKSSS